MPTRPRTSTGRPPAHQARQPVSGKPLHGREVIVALGQGEPLERLTRTLQTLGVEMLGSGAQSPSEPWTHALNEQLLEAVGRPAGHPAYALPFPAGWWRSSDVRPLRQAMTDTLKQTLDEERGPWGFAAPATARLLPVWNEVFDVLGVSPAYVWSVGAPTQAAAAKTTANRAEILWFAQAADILRYAGEPLVVIDERLWAEKPQDIVEALCARLGLRWRGTRLDLYEILNEIADGAEPPSSSKRPSLPLATALYEAVLKMESDAEARAKAHSIAETAELLRPMIAPLLPSHNDLLLPAPRAAETEALTRELESLRETTAELRRQLGAMSNGGGGHIAELQRELDARTAEIRWLQEQHALQLREAEEENELLREASAHLMNGHAAAPADAEEITAARAEIERLQNEMANLNNANERYLARIYELKRALQDRGEGGGLG